MTERQLLLLVRVSLDKITPATPGIQPELPELIYAGLVKYVASGSRYVLTWDGRLAVGSALSAADSCIPSDRIVKKES